MYWLPSKLRKMPARRIKIALVRRVQKDLNQFVGRPNSPFLRAEVLRAILHRQPVVEIAVHPFQPIERINIQLQVSRSIVDGVESIVCENPIGDAQTPACENAVASE